VIFNFFVTLRPFLLLFSISFRCSTSSLRDCFFSSSAESCSFLLSPHVVRLLNFPYSRAFFFPSPSRFPFRRFLWVVYLNFANSVGCQRRLKFFFPSRCRLLFYKVFPFALLLFRSLCFFPFFFFGPSFFFLFPFP